MPQNPFEEFEDPREMNVRLPSGRVVRIPEKPSEDLIDVLSGVEETDLRQHAGFMRLLRAKAQGAPEVVRLAADPSPQARVSDYTNTERNPGARPGGLPDSRHYGDELPQPERRNPREWGVSESGLGFIKGFEAPDGPILTVHDDGAGNPTIGHGHLVQRGESFPNGITATEADAMLAADLAEAERKVRQAITVPLTQMQYDALVSLAANSPSALGPKSTVVNEINAGNIEAAANAIQLYDKAQVGGAYVTLDGLTTRRERERDIFRGGVYDSDH
jgi:lysozyme